MEQLRINKLETAQRQMQTAVQLFFENGDAISIHTLASAAYNVIRDVNNSRQGKPMFAKQRYVQMGGKPLSALNEAENFFKHGDRDPNATIDFFPKYTECLLVDACEKYSELTGQNLPEFLFFTLWLICQDPDRFKIPQGWEAFVEDGKELHARGDREGFYQRLMDHSHEINGGSAKGT